MSGVPEGGSGCEERAGKPDRDERLVQLTAISGDKYFGRVVADLTLPDGTRPAEDLLEAGLVDPYSGRTKSKRLCPSVMKDR